MIIGKYLPILESFTDTFPHFKLEFFVNSDLGQRFSVYTAFVSRYPVWLETTVADGWALNQQNSEGES